jgi:hypothetical protein
VALQNKRITVQNKYEERKSMVESLKRTRNQIGVTFFKDSEARE